MDILKEIAVLGFLISSALVFGAIDIGFIVLIVLMHRKGRMW